MILNAEDDFNFISLPDNLQELSEKYNNITCNNCSTSPVYSILCLICGEKICYTNSCCKNLGKHKNLHEYVHHNKICGNGDGVFLHLYDGRLTFSLLGQFVTTYINLYQNAYGEDNKGTHMSKEFILSEEMLGNITEEFRNFSFFKYFKITSSTNLHYMEGQNDDEN
jgi:hypothetical protein